MVMVIASCQVPASIVLAVVVDGTSKKKKQKKRTRRRRKKKKKKKKKKKRKKEMEKERIWCWWVIADAFLSCRMCRRFIRPLYSDLDRLAVWLNLANSIPSQCRYTSHRSINRIDVPPLSLSLFLSTFLFIYCCLSVCQWGSACGFCYNQSIFRALSGRFRSDYQSLAIRTVGACSGCDHWNTTRNCPREATCHLVLTNR